MDNHLFLPTSHLAWQNQPIFLDIDVLSSCRMAAWGPRGELLRLVVEVNRKGELCTCKIGV